MMIWRTETIPNKFQDDKNSPQMDPIHKMIMKIDEKSKARREK